jgi:hypothetical protein
MLSKPNSFTFLNKKAKEFYVAQPRWLKASDSIAAAMVGPI